jgi:hypothetical protein
MVAAAAAAAVAISVYFGSLCMYPDFLTKHTFDSAVALQLSCGRTTHTRHLRSQVRAGSVSSSML